MLSERTGSSPVADVNFLGLFFLFEDLDGHSRLIAIYVLPLEW